MRSLIVVSAAGLLALEGCGFTPLYADTASGGPLLRNVSLDAVNGGETLTETIQRSAARRLAAGADEALYGLVLDVREQAVPLAVQIDDSVTRYTYRMSMKYTLSRRADGVEFSGEVEAISSFNVVSSQYSTLYAEEAARDKAAANAFEQLERSILLKLSPEEQAAISARQAARAPRP